jgi:WD40 repeat protein
VYASALVFSPAYSITRNLFQNEEPDWIVTKPHTEHEWTACLLTLEGHSGWVVSATFSPDGKLVVSASYDKTLKVWDPVTGTCTQTLQGHNDEVISATFSPDGKFIVSASHDKTLKVWDPATGICIQTLQGHNGGVSSTTFSPDGKFMVSASYDRTLKVWDPATGTCIQTLQGHNGRVVSAMFSPDGKLVVSASCDKTLKVWDPATGTCTQTLQGHNDRASSTTFSPDGKLVVSASCDKTLKVWDPGTGTCIQTFIIGLTLRNVSFNTSGSHLDSQLETEIGVINLGSPHVSKKGLPNTQQSLLRQGYGLNFDRNWITRDSENWLWLPLEYRPTCSAVAVSTIAIGCASGRVLIMKFI